MKRYYMLRLCDLRWTCILKILGSNQGQVTAYLDRVFFFRIVPQFPQSSVRVMAQNSLLISFYAV